MDDVETRYLAKDALLARLAHAQNQPHGRLSVVIDCGPAKGWVRFIGGAKRDLLPCFIVEWTDEYASLIFLDDAWSEHRAIDSARPVAAAEETRRQIAHGEPGPHPSDECMEKTRAFDAMRQFINDDARPAWLSYKYVR